MVRSGCTRNLVHCLLCVFININKCFGISWLHWSKPKGMCYCHFGNGVRDGLFSLRNVVLKVFLFFSLSFPKNNWLWLKTPQPTLRYINNNRAYPFIYFWKKFHPARFFMIKPINQASKSRNEKNRDLMRTPLSWSLPDRPIGFTL